MDEEEQCSRCLVNRLRNVKRQDGKDEIAYRSHAFCVLRNE